MAHWREGLNREGGLLERGVFNKEGGSLERGGFIETVIHWGEGAK